MFRPHGFLVASTLACLLAARPWAAAAPPMQTEDLSGQPVSYWKQVRPVFQAHCQGCHQPARARGGYVMTDFARLLAGGESGAPAVVPGQPAASTLLASITPRDGVAEMPKDKAPLAPPQLELVRRWIAEGAADDTPRNAVQRIDAAHPPVYLRPPVITSLDFSPDGTLLAVAGFHEVLLHRADGGGLVARLIGLAERIESVRFSPDGRRLAVAGGLPARMGEVQVWDVAERRLALSVPVGHDTVYGVSWSPDGRLVAFGCPDNTLRAIDARTGEQVLQQGSHNDWVLGTVFSQDGSHLMSVGRDMSAKLTEVATQRFVDNITSITPGALRGGLHAIARRPGRDEILIGGADGAPQLYLVFRQAARKIGDNANLLRRFPAMEGRVFAVAYSPDGRRLAAASSLNGRGAVHFFPGEHDTAIPAELLKAYTKVATTYTAAERQALEAFTTRDTVRAAAAEFGTAVYALAFSPDGERVAAAGEDGRVRLIRAADGAVAAEFVPVPLAGPAVSLGR